ncbi:ABC transporter permease [Lederbergia wuyishanensis]|uniref:ABC-2 type transport system permease protein n=1 Tax=Lederbergia wuyishanensis TaxID=1347903 RepID=A0ABU0D2I0_9BACI|nr:ABC transporter permease [Lederbergia wuyishanensis]MCJ8007232.1 ABC transporter permease [Lederbergia wuyishanensis]MDQ0342618.1 ABC-2 type transport system permease protein [Lederbergia wuyishanensis]
MKSKTRVLQGRLMRNIMRSPDTIITVAITPIMMMLLFVYVFGGAIETGTDNYVNYLLPGILLMARFITMPIKRSSILWAHVLTSLVSNVFTVVVVIFVALLMGFRSSADILHWLAVAGILVLFTLALTWLAVIPGLTAGSMEGATAYSYPLIFLPFISSAFVPTETMPKIVRAFAENQPVTSIVNAIRALLNDGSVGTDIWIALAWCFGIMVIAYLFASKQFKRQLG